MIIVNPDNLQAIITDRKKQQNNPTSIKVNDVNINSENSVRLLRLEKIRQMFNGNTETKNNGFRRF